MEVCFGLFPTLFFICISTFTVVSFVSKMDQKMGQSSKTPTKTFNFVCTLGMFEILLGLASRVGRFEVNCGVQTKIGEYKNGQ